MQNESSTPDRPTNNSFIDAAHNPKTASSQNPITSEKPIKIVLVLSSHKETVHPHILSQPSALSPIVFAKIANYNILISPLNLLFSVTSLSILNAREDLSQEFLTMLKLKD